MTHTAPYRSTLLQDFRIALLSLLAMLATLGCVLAIDAEAGPAVLAVVLAMSLSRSQLDHDWRGRIEAAVVLPLVGLMALAVGMLLLRSPVIGAVLFVAGMALPIWLRRFGADVRRLGSLVALPLVALLMTPYIPPQRLGPLSAVLMPMIVALIALAWVNGFQWLGRRIAWLPPLTRRAAPHTAVLAASPAAPSAVGLRPIASTRMAVQMAVALGAAFVIGFAFFPQRWAWIVMSAFIVNSGNRGRGDVAYKSVLRVAGAAAGTLGALLLNALPDSGDAVTAALMLLAVFLGLWLRPHGYAWWALFVTLALVLLQRFTGAQLQVYLWPRLEEIAIGALCGVAAAWFVLPVRSISVLRLRLANALAALSTALDPETPTPTPMRTADDFLAAVAEVEQVAPAFRAWRRVSRGRGPLQPADWVDALHASSGPAAAIIASGQVPKGLRTEVGKARKAMREPAEILPALQSLKRALEQVP